MLYIFLLILLVVADSHSWFFDKTKTNGKSESNNNIQYNPLCLLIDCEENTLKNKRELAFSFNPECWFSECDENKYIKFNPYCWFTSCEKREDDFHWITDEQIVNWVKEKLQNIKCWFKACPTKKKEAKLTVYDKVKGFFNDGKQQESIIKNFLKSDWNPYCWQSECCNKNSIPSDTETLGQIMRQYLHGQPLTETLVDAISAHWNLNIKPPKALVLSFHGSVGVGKNFLTRLIAKSLFKLGMKSKYVHYYTGRIDFTLNKDTDIYMQNLYDWLRSNVTQCPKQLFIFDGIENMPSSILNDMKPLLDYRDLVDGVDYRECIFIFISNIGSELISKEYQKLVDSGKKREEIILGDFEKIVTEGAFIHEGAFYNSDVIKFNLIDHYIPFLPLEEEHVKYCIKSAFLLRNVEDPQPDHIKNILDTLSWHATNHTRFSATGCKNIASKVSLISKKFYETVDDKSEL